MPAEDDGFLSRWSRRKALVRQGERPAEPPAGAPVADVPAAPAHRPAPPPEPPPSATATAEAPAAPAVAEAPPSPTLADVAALTRESDYARFVAPGVDTGVKNAALKKLFTDPHFNVMDGLDTYIDDYGRPDPLPAGMLRQMAQSQFLGLFSDDPTEDRPRATAAALPPDVPPDLPPVAPTDPLPEARPAATTALADPAAAPPPLPEPTPPRRATPDEDPDLRLQPHDAAGPHGAGPGVGPHAGRQP